MHVPIFAKKVFESRRQAIWFLIALFLLSTPLWVDMPKQGADADSCTYAFADFPAEQYFSGEPAIVDFSTHPPAREFRTVISRQAAEGGVNFAGRYVVAEWGCGTNCGVAAIVDAQTGAIAEYGLIANFGFAYRPDSTLFIVNPEANKPKPPSARNWQATTTYYTLESGALEKLCEK